MIVHAAEPFPIGEIHNSVSISSSANAVIYLRVHVVRINTCGTKRRLSSRNRLHIRTHPTSPLSSINFPIHSNHQLKEKHSTHTKRHNTTTMPDQVKYANKLQGKNVLVIGGSSGSPSPLPSLPLKCTPH